MINPATKFQVAREMLNAGMLCKCDNWQHGVDEYDETNSELIHYPDCEGQEKVMQVLNGDNHD